MLTDFQSQKIKKLFQFWDIDNNGYLEQADYVQLAERVAAERGWASGSTETASAYNALMASWGQIAQFADTDHNAQITPKEWTAFCTAMVQDSATYRIAGMELMMALFSAVDTDGDGQLTLDDFKMWFRIYKADESEAEAAFARIDTDGSGKLSIDELILAVDDFYHSDDPESPGNYLFGEL
jgi:Ca2+-binding EF-hand superfamily protein